MSLTFTPTHIEDPVELIFLGTGTSSSLPHIECLTAPAEEVPCKTCLSTLKPEGKKNIRRNTSAAMRMTAKDGRKVYALPCPYRRYQGVPPAVHLAR